jgi:citrate lyase subunit beta / citryl-CoA lyase
LAVRFAAAIGAEASEEALLLPSIWPYTPHAARGSPPIGLIGSMAGYQDLAAFESLTRRSRAGGFEGASCINPAQIPALNAAFTPTEAELDH